MKIGIKWHPCNQWFDWYTYDGPDHQYPNGSFVVNGARLAVSCSSVRQWLYCKWNGSMRPVRFRVKAKGRKT